MKFIDALQDAKKEIRLLRLIILGLIGLCALMVIGWTENESNVTVHIPATIPETGVTLRQGIIPKSTIYDFAIYAWQGINHWADDGYKDYKIQINTFSPLITPTFQAQLTANYNELVGEGELQDRTRELQLTYQSLYKAEDVKQIDRTSWLVHLPMRLIETLKSNGMVVKDVQMDYVLKVTVNNDDAAHNPYGLVLAGFATTPKRIKTNV